MIVWQMKAHQKWIGMVILGVIFTSAGLAALIGSFFVDEALSRWVIFGVGVLVLIAGLTPLVFAPRARRESSLKSETDLVPAQPVANTGDLDKPWPLAVLAGALAEELAGTSYLVEHNDRLIRVTWDLGDQSWWVLAQKNGTNRIFETRLVRAGPGRLSRTDHWHALDWQAGLPVVASMRSETAGGRVWRYEKRKEWGTGPDGLGKKLDYTFSTGDLDRPLAAVLDRAGWAKPAWGAEAKGALIVGGIGASAIVIVPLFFLIQWLMGR